jgi:hypothetical protein
MTLSPFSAITSDNASIIAVPLPAWTGDKFTLGVDIGQAHDPTAICALKTIERADTVKEFQCGYIGRLPLGMPYPDQVAHVLSLHQRLRPKCELVVDATGVGRAVADMFVYGGMSPIRVTITSGTAVTNEGSSYGVPKMELVSRLQSCLHNGTLKIQKDLAEAQALISELQNFTATVTDSGRWTFGARSGKHDDIVLSLAIALWRAYTEEPGISAFYRRLSQGLDPVTGQKPEAEKLTAVLMAPVGISCLYDTQGNIHRVGPGRLVRMPEAEARIVLMGNIGWTRAPA